MDRETFMNNIVITDSDIFSAFESLMALYNLYIGIGVYDNIQITKVPSELASFDIKFDNKDYAKKVHETMNGLFIRIYGVPYNVTCTVDGKIAHVILK